MYSTVPYGTVRYCTVQRLFFREVVRYLLYRCIALEYSRQRPDPWRGAHVDTLYARVHLYRKPNTIQCEGEALRPSKYYKCSTREPAWGHFLAWYTRI